MPPSISEKLITGKKLRERGKYKEALELALNIENNEKLTSEERVKWMIFKGDIYTRQGKAEDALEITEQAYQESLQQGNKLQALDALGIKGFSYWLLRDYEKYYELMNEREKLFNSITGATSHELIKRKAALMSGKAGVHVMKNEWDLALKYQQKALRLFEEVDDKINIAVNLYYAGVEYYQLGKLNQALKCEKQVLALKGIHNYSTIRALNFIGEIYRTKGELELALDYYKQALKLAEELDNKPTIIESLNSLGLINYELGELEQSLKFLKKCVTIAEKQKIPYHLVFAFNQLIKIYVAKNSIEEARHYLQCLQDLRNQYKIKIFNQLYRIANAYLLKRSAECNDLDEAERLLRQVTEDDKNTRNLTEIALVYLCEILLNKISKTNSSEILEEIKSITTRLLKISEEQHSYRWLVHTHLLQGKISLVEKDINGARILFSQAQQMAEWHGLSILARKISSEHDLILEDIEKWEELHNTNAPLSERIKFSSMATTLEVLEGNQRLEITELEREDPILLAVMSKTGYMIFTNPFSVEVPFDESRIGEFVTYFNSISGQMYSESLDRAKFGDHTIILKTLDSISFCYLFEGESYAAQLRLNNFCESIKKNPHIKEILNTAIHTGHTINIEDHPKLEILIAENFLSDPQKFQVSHEEDELQKLVKKSRKIRKRKESRKKRISRTFKSEILIEVISLLLYLTSHLLFLAVVHNIPLSGIFPNITDALVYVVLTLYLGIACHLLVLALLVINWQNERIKNKAVNREIIIQIIALILFLTAHFFYLSYVGGISKLEWTGEKYAVFIDIFLFPGFGCQILVIYLIIDDYTKNY
jgi:tetratricopeptide (TPR) repeat protein